MKVELHMPDALDPATAGLVQAFAEALAQKLYASQLKHGYSDNWLRDDWEPQCRADLHRHVMKGDPRDAAVYCAFMWYRDWSTSPAEAVRIASQ